MSNKPSKTAALNRPTVMIGSVGLALLVSLMGYLSHQVGTASIWLWLILPILGATVVAAFVLASPRRGENWRSLAGNGYTKWENLVGYCLSQFTVSIILVLMAHGDHQPVTRFSALGVVGTMLVFSIIGAGMFLFPHRSRPAAPVSVQSSS
jgi:hypothetical protein